MLIAATPGPIRRHASDFERCAFRLAELKVGVGRTFRVMYRSILGGGRICTDIRAHGDEPDIISLGSDGRSGGDGTNTDVASWNNK